jgi:hypothetical protein
MCYVPSLSVACVQRYNKKGCRASLRVPHIVSLRS